MPPYNHFGWTGALFAGLTSLAVSTPTPDPGQCPWGMLLSQSIPQNAICPPISKTGPALKNNSWDPWTQKPLCLRAGKAPHKTYCAFSSSSFRRGRGIGVITTLEGASDVDSAMRDPYYSWTRGVQSLNPTIVDEQENATWEIRDIQGKGKGVVALRTIQPGEVIILDYPVLAALSTFKQDLLGDQWRQLVDHAVESLPDASILLNLAHTSGGTVVDDVIRTNNYGVDYRSTEYMSIFPVVSRVNHACNPQAMIRFTQQTFALEVVAHRVISPGEEITVSYINPGLNHESRLEELLTWDFDCRCSLCSSGSSLAISDGRRNRINEILEILSAPGPSVKEIGKLSSELLRLAELEGITPKFGDYYDTVATAYFRHQEFRHAEVYLKKSVDHWLMYDCPDQARVEGARWFLNLLRRIRFRQH